MLFSAEISFITPTCRPSAEQVRLVALLCDEIIIISFLLCFHAKVQTGLLVNSVLNIRNVKEMKT